jgi:hypothetical protein
VSNRDLVTARWRIENEDQADWALSKLARATQQAATIDKQTQARVAAVNDAATKAARRYKATIEFMDLALRRWRRDTLTDTTGLDLDDITEPADAAVWTKTTKAMVLPSGSLNASLTVGGFKVEDQRAFIQWSIGLAGIDRDILPEWVNTSVLVSAIPKSWQPGPLRSDDGYRNVVTPDGEVVPGLVWRPARVTVSVKPRADVEWPEFLPTPEGCDDLVEDIEEEAA